MLLEQLHQNDVLMSTGKGRQFNGLWDVYKQTYKLDGLIGLYRGFIISCYTVIVYRGMYLVYMIH